MTLYGAFFAMGRRGLLRFIPDRAYLKIQYRLKLGRKLNLEKPVTYNEKLQWLKLHDRKAVYTQMADKVAARDFVRARVGEDCLVPLIAVYNSVEEIDWAALPDKFAMKCAHASSANILCRDKAALDIREAKKKLSRWMGRSWFWPSREWPYKDVPRRIIAEKFLEADWDVPRDYKIMCFDGEPEYIIVDFDRYENHTRNYYDADWRRVRVRNRHPNHPEDAPRPEKLTEMLSIARELSRGVPHLRVDLYEVGGKVYFGEMTFFHGYGMETFEPREFEVELGARIRIQRL